MARRPERSRRSAAPELGLVLRATANSVTAGVPPAAPPPPPPRQSSTPALSLVRKFFPACVTLRCAEMRAPALPPLSAGYKARRGARATLANGRGFETIRRRYLRPRRRPSRSRMITSSSPVSSSSIAYLLQPYTCACIRSRRLARDEQESPFVDQPAARQYDAALAIFPSPSESELQRPPLGRSAPPRSHSLDAEPYRHYHRKVAKACPASNLCGKARLTHA